MKLIRYTLLFTLVLFFNKQIGAQGYSRMGYVLAKPALNLRSAPNAEGTIISKVTYSSELKVRTDIAFHTDTLDGEVNVWYPIHYNNKTAYAWGRYITFNQNLVLDYGLLTIGQDGSKYNTDLNWYGIFECDSNGFNQIKQVDVSLVEQDDSYYGRRGNIVKINLSERPLFLFGSKNLLDNKIVAGKVIIAEYDAGNWQKEYKAQLDESFLYPEEIMSLRLNDSRNQLQMKAKDAPYIDSTRNSIHTRYELEVTNESFYRHESIKTQNITAGIPFINTSSFRCAMYRNPRIVWYGDIDFDQKIDFVLRTREMAETDVAEGMLLLYLSSQAEEGEFVKMVAKTNGDY